MQRISETQFESVGHLTNPLTHSPALCLQSPPVSVNSYAGSGQTYNIHSYNYLSFIMTLRLSLFILQSPF